MRVRASMGLRAYTRPMRVCTRPYAACVRVLCARTRPMRRACVYGLVCILCARARVLCARARVLCAL